MTQHTLVAVFDTPAHAEAAVADLMAANVRADCVSRHNKTPDTTQTTRPAREPGFWESLFGTDPDPYTTVYDRSIESGATVVTVKIEEDQADRVMAILERHHPIDLDERAAGYGVDTSASAMPHTPGATSTAERVASDVKSAVSNAASNVKAAVTGTSSAGTSSTGTSSTGTASTAARSDRESEVIQLAEEQLQVGKRVVSGGTTRIRRYVVERPVQEQVTLRDSKVVVERHAVTGDRPVANADFTEKTVEMSESREEPVVSKTARVTEEVRLRKESTERVETVRDTVRRDEIEVEGTDKRTSARPAATTKVGTTENTVKPRR